VEANPEPTLAEARRSSISRIEIALIATLIAIWVPGILQLAEVWRTVEYASHGFLVPLVALWAATAHREELRSLTPRPMRGGGLLLAVVAALYLVALVLRNPTALGLVAVATVVVTVLALRGVAWVSTLRFSLAYLLFMVPLPTGWVTPVIVQLQILVSSIAVEILQQIGVSIFREGNVLTLPGGVSLFVAEACSGITSIVTLVPLAVFLAYFTQRTLPRRLILVAAVIPVAMLGNLLRVLLTIIVAIRFGADVATDEAVHTWAGIGTYVLGCLALLAVGALMKRLVPESKRVKAG
jgi:exosortase